MKAYLKRIAYYLPENIVANDDLIKDFPEWSVEKITSKVGVRKRHCVRENETALDLALKAAEKIFEDGQVKKEDIDYVLFCTQSPDYFLPTSACILQKRLGLSTHIGALDFNLGCSGYVYGLSLAKGLIYANIAKNVLLITGETYTKYLHKKDKGNRSIFGDAATATIVSTEGYAEILDFALGTDGSGAKNLIVKNGGSKNPFKTGEINWDDNNNPISPDYLYMSGNDIFVFTLDAVPSLVLDTLKINNLEKSQIDLFVFHQANKFILDYLRKKMKIEVERFYYCLEDFGNTVSSTIPIALSEAINNGQIKENMNVLIAGFGVGYSWGGTVLSFKK